MINWDNNVTKLILIGITFIASFLFTVLLSPLWLLLLLIPLFAIPVAREIGLTKDADERELFEGYRNSHLAFYTIMILLVTVSAERVLKGEYIEHFYFALIAVGIILKLVNGLKSHFGSKIAGLVLLVLHLVFVTSLNLPFWATLPPPANPVAGLTFFVAFGIAAFFFPFICGIVFLGMGIYASVSLTVQMLELTTSYFSESLLQTFVFYPLPILLAGFLFIAGSNVITWLKDRINGVPAEVRS